MPTLPPRNLPFSTPPRTPPAKGETPTASLGGPTKAGTPSKLRATGSDGSGVLPRQDETTYHRRLRAILWDVRSGCEKWEDVVSLEGAKTVAAIARLSAALDDILARRREDESHNIAGMLPLPPSMAEAQRLEEMAILLRGLETERQGMADVMAKVLRAKSRLESLTEAAEGLLIDATRAKGAEFTFEREMWVTWSMERFVGVIQILVSRHVLQTTQLQALSRLLVEDGCAPGQSSQSIVQENNGKTALDSEEDEVEDEDEGGDGDSDEGNDKRTKRARIRERVMEEWQKLSLLPDHTTGISLDWFEDVCGAEVGRWEEK